MFDIDKLRQNIAELEEQIEQIKAEIGEEEFSKRILSAFENTKPYKQSPCYPCER